MLRSNSKDVLQCLIENLPFSRQFKDVMKANDLKTLQTVVNINVWELLKMPGIDMHIMSELVKFLLEKKLSHLLIH